MQQKSKWKTWHKVTVAILLVLFFLIGKFVSTQEEKGEQKYLQSLTQAQKDSIALAKTMEGGKFEAEVNLRTYITSRLNDPKSFDVIDQKTWIIGNTIVVMIDYTAKNAFGGTVRKTIKAEADADGTLTKVFDN